MNMRWWRRRRLRDEDIITTPAMVPFMVPYNQEDEDQSDVAQDNDPGAEPPKHDDTDVGDARGEDHSDPTPSDPTPDYSGSDSDTGADYSGGSDYSGSDSGGFDSGGGSDSGGW